MKNFLIICSIFVFAYFVRFHQYSDKVIFGTEQALSLFTSLNYLDKPSLLGQEYFRQDSNSHTIFSGALFNYILLPITLFSKYDPIKITTFFGLLNIVTGLFVYAFCKRYLNNKTAIYSSVLFLFSNLMIYHSLFIWNYNLLPLVGLTLFYLTYRNFKVSKLNNFFYLGLVSGFGISLQILFIIYAIFIFLVNIIKTKQKALGLLVFGLGVIIGNLPMFLFDLRHDFYNINTIWQYLIDTTNGRSDAGFAYYYLLPLVPVVAIIFGWILSKLNVYFATLLIILYLFINLKSLIINPTLTVSEIDYTARIIANDAKSEFNIASTIDFDKRSYPIRYFLKYKYQKNVLSVTEYSNIRTLYVLAPNDYNFKRSDTWEIKAGGSYKVTEIRSVNKKYSLFKLTK